MISELFILNDEQNAHANALAAKILDLLASELPENANYLVSTVMFAALGKATSSVIVGTSIALELFNCDYLLLLSAFQMDLYSACIQAAVSNKALNFTKKPEEQDEST